MAKPEDKEQNILLADINPSLLLNGETPRLIDEWQLAPKLWDAVRFEVDHRGEEGQFILTGSSVPANMESVSHTGTGRFSWLTMRPMSLYESGESTGEINLNELFSNPNSISGINKLNLEMASHKVETLINSAKDVGALKIIVSKVENFDNDMLKLICDDLKSRFQNVVVVLANIGSEKSNIIISAGKIALENGVNAGALVKEVAKLTGGNGGGRKDMAMAGIKDVSKIDLALGKVHELVIPFAN